MSANTELDRFNAPVAAPAVVGQATAVEQSRAIAEVQAAIVVAQQCPRDVQKALRDMREVCALKPLADRAFYNYRRGGSPVTGATIHLARELARIWGNVQYGVDEMRRDDEGGFSEMKAWAWDVQTNTRPSQTFVVPHERDKGNTRDKLSSLRDIYENNANMGARRVRAQIFSILPSWFTDEAKDICRRTIEEGGGVPLAHRIEKIIGAYHERFGITEEQLATRIGKPASEWKAQDVADLEILGRSIANREVDKDEEFPPPQVTAADIAAPRQAARKPRPVKAVETPAVQVEDPPGDYDPTTEPGWQGGASS
jgi:hypothetical protein